MKFIAALFWGLAAFMVVAQSQAATAAPSSAPAVLSTKGPPGPTKYPFALNAAYKGYAVYVQGLTNQGNCKIDEPGTVALAGVPTGKYVGSEACGVCIEVTGAKSKAVAKVVDECNGCAENELSLSPTIYTLVTGLAGPARFVNITYKPVACSGTKPLGFQFAGGSSPYFLSVQVLNHATAVVKLEVSSTKTKGEFIVLTRQEHNYFNTQAAGDGPFTFRLTFITGKTTSVANVPLLNDNVFPTRTPTRTPTVTKTPAPTKGPLTTKAPVVITKGPVPAPTKM